MPPEPVLTGFREEALPTTRRVPQRILQVYSQKTRRRNKNSIARRGGVVLYTSNVSYNRIRNLIREVSDDAVVETSTNYYIQCRQTALKAVFGLTYAVVAYHSPSAVESLTLLYIGGLLRPPVMLYNICAMESIANVAATTVVPGLTYTHFTQYTFR